MGKSIKIKSLEMGSYYDYSLGNRDKLAFGKAVLDISLFVEFMLSDNYDKKSKIIINEKRNITNDFLMCKFNFGIGDISSYDLRKEYYNNGFTIDWTEYQIRGIKSTLKYLQTKNCNVKDIIKLEKKLEKLNNIDLKNHITIKYKRLMRSTGKAKDGDCLFINEKLFEKANWFIKMGLTLPYENAKIVEMSAYETMTCANMEGKIRIPLNQMLILKDKEVSFLTNAVKVKTKNITSEYSEIDYKALDDIIKNTGYTFYKNNVKKESDFELLQMNKKDIEDKGIKYITKKVENKKDKIIKELDMSEMEIQANNIGLTFSKKKSNNSDFKLIDSTKYSYLESLGLHIIKKDKLIKSGDEYNVPDYEQMECSANKVGYTFKKKNAKRDGRELIEKSIDNIINLLNLDVNSVPKKNIKDIEFSECYVERSNEKIPVKNVMWDGMLILDSSIFPSYCNGFAYLRNHMFKANGNVGEVVKFLKDYYGDKYETATIKDMFDNEIKVKDIRAITTENAIKWLKFSDLMGNNLKEAYEYYDKWLRQFDYQFQIVKTSHKSKYGNLQRMSYQGVNSLPCINIEELKDIAKSSIEYCNRLKKDNAMYLDWLSRNSNICNNNQMLIDLYNTNKNFKNTDYWNTEKSTKIKNFKRNRLMLGKLLQEGDNLTLCGNPYALLLYAVGEDWENDETLNYEDGTIQCFTTRFKDGEYIGGYRNPQNSPNNYIYMHNHYSKKMLKYFPHLGDNVIAINMIKTDFQPRANGADEDTDALFLTNQRTAVKYSKICYNEYPTIINEISLKGSSNYYNNMDNYAKMDYSIAKYQCGIGWSANVAQLALSYYWDELFNTGVKNKELEDVFIITSVLSQCYIDSAKREFDIDLNMEMMRLNNLQCMKKEFRYPEFFANIQKMKIKLNDKGKKKKEQEIDEKTMKECNCPMELLSDIINNNILNNYYGRRNSSEIAFEKLLNNKNIKEKDINREQVKAILSKIDEFNSNILSYNSEDDDYIDNLISDTDDFINDLNSRYKTLKKDTMCKIIEKSFTTNSKMKKSILTTLYNMDKNKFLSLFEEI